MARSVSPSVVAGAVCSGGVGRGSSGFTSGLGGSGTVSGFAGSAGLVSVLAGGEEGPGGDVGRGRTDGRRVVSSGSAVVVDDNGSVSIGSTSCGGGGGISSAGASGVVFACACVHAAEPHSPNPVANTTNATDTSERSFSCFRVFRVFNVQASGSRTVNVVPAPGVDCTSISPSCI